LIFCHLKRAGDVKMSIIGGKLERITPSTGPTYGAPIYYTDTPDGFVRVMFDGTVEQWVADKYVCAGSEKIVDELGNTYVLPLFSRPTRYGAAMYRVGGGQISNFTGAAITIRGEMKLDVFVVAGQLFSRGGPCINMQMAGATMHAYALGGLIHHDFRYAIRYVDANADTEIKVFMRHGKISYFSKDVPSVVIRKGNTTHKYWLLEDEIYVPSVKGRLCLGSLDYKWYNCITEKNGVVKHKSYVSCGKGAKRIDVNCAMFDFLRDCMVPLPYMSFNVVKHCIVGPYNGVDYAINGIVYTPKYVKYRGGSAEALWKEDVQKIFGKGIESIRGAQAGKLPAPVQIARIPIPQIQCAEKPKKTGSTTLAFTGLTLRGGPTPWPESEPDQIKWSGVGRTITDNANGLPVGNPVEFTYEE
jgi:hypothetical protein